MGLRAAAQISRPCHLATGWRTERIIRFQCSSSVLLSFPTVNCPIRCLGDFQVVWVSYTEIMILHCSTGNSGSENISTSLKTFTRHRATTEVFCDLSLQWLHWTLILTYTAVQHKNSKSITLYVTLSVCVCVCVYGFSWFSVCQEVCYLPASEHISVGTVLTLSRPTSSLWEVGRNFSDRSTSPTRSCPEWEEKHFINLVCD